MSSTFTQNLNLEMPGTGDQAGTWGVTANNNYVSLDTAISGSISVPLPTNQTTPSAPLLLSTLQGQNPGDLPAGLYKIVALTGAQSATGYVQIDPSTAQRYYFLRNQSIDSGGGAGHPLVIQQVQTGQSPGATFTLQAGYDAVVYADGAGNPANVYGALNNPQFNNVLIQGKLTVEGSQAQTSLSLNTTNVTDTTQIRQILYTTSDSARWSIEATAGPSETDPNNPASDLKLLAYDTTGNLSANGSVMYINRASGNVVIGPSANIPGNTLQFPLGNARLTVFPSTQTGALDQPSLNVVGKLGQASAMFLVQTFNPTAAAGTNPYANVFAIDSTGNLRILGDLEMWSSGSAQSGVNGTLSVGGVNLTFVGGVLVGAS